jgi:hypothetical protein
MLAMQPDLIGDASTKDLQALFGGLDTFATNSFPLPNSFLGHENDQFPTGHISVDLTAHAHFSPSPQLSSATGFGNGFYPIAADCSHVPQTQAQAHPSSWTVSGHLGTQAADSAFAMHQLDAVVNDLGIHCPPHPSSCMTESAVSFAHLNLHS